MSRITVAALIAAVIAGCMVGVNGTAIANCWFNPAYSSSLSGNITFMQADSTSDIVVQGWVIADTTGSMMNVFAHVYGDMYAGTNRGGCFLTGSDAAIFTFTPDVAVNNGYWVSTTIPVASASLYGSNSLLGRGLSVYAAATTSCASAVSAASSAIQQCVIGFHRDGTTGTAMPTNEAYSQPSTAPAALYAQFVGSALKPEFSGDLYIVPNNAIPNQVWIEVNIPIAAGLVASTQYSIHIHWFGDMTCGDDVTGAGVACVGGHFNPLGQIHGYPSSYIRHAGDLGNVNTSADGSLYFVGSYDLVNISGINNVIGRGVVFHALRDDGNPTGSSTSTGAAGARWGRGVLGISSRRPTDTIAATAYCSFGSMGAITLTQANANTPVGIWGSITASAAGTWGLYPLTYGDLYMGTSGGSCYAGSVSFNDFVATAAGAVKMDPMWTSQITLFGSSSMIGRSFALYDASGSACGSSPAAQCVVGIAGATVQGTQTLGNTAVNMLASNPTSAHCQFVQSSTAPTDKTIMGDIMFSPSTTTSGEIYVFLNVSGVDAYSRHSVHVHVYGDLSDTTGTALGGHWNPYGMTHGVPPSIYRHQGDIGNVTADADGRVIFYGDFNLLTLIGTGNIIGRGVVFHQRGDDGNPLNTSLSTGDAGLRYARCAIGISARSPPQLITASSSTAGLGGGAMAQASFSFATLIAAVVALFVARRFVA